MAWTYSLPTKILFGKGSIARLAEYVPGEKVLLVTSPFARKTGLLEKIVKLLAGKRVVIFDGIEPNPTHQSIDEGAALLQREWCDCVLGAGGGSVLDAAKLMAALPANGGSIREYAFAGKTLAHAGLPFTAVPTTAGTASEVTPFAVVSDKEKKLKAPIRSPLLFPYAAVLDPELTHTLPRGPTAESGADALAHAVEAFWTTGSGPMTDILVLESVRVITSSLATVCEKPQDAHGREQMLYGSLLAGLAFSNTGTAGVHACSYPLTALFGVPHGNACSLLLPEFLEFNGRGSERMKTLARAMGEKTPKKAAEKLRTLFKCAGLKTRLSEAGIAKQDVPRLVKDSMIPQMGKNPRNVKAKDLEKMLLKIL